MLKLRNSAYYSLLDFTYRFEPPQVNKGTKIILQYTEACWYSNFQQGQAVIVRTSSQVLLPA